jgi:hypothetical protein
MEKSRMKLIASRFALALAGMILITMTVALATSRPDDCGLLTCPRPHATATATAGAPTPTLAPSQNLVFVRVESDKPDIQIGWAEN